MPYKSNKPENLIPLTKRTEEEARKIRHDGAMASAESKRQRRLLRELLADALQEDIQLRDKDGKPTGKSIKAEIAITKGLILQASKGNSRAYEVIRDTLGEKPAETTIIQTTQQRPSIKEIFAFQDELDELADEDNEQTDK